MTPSRTLQFLWAAVAVQLLGRLLDLRWHLTNDEFEGTAQQFEAHWLLWLGVIATIAIAAVGWRSSETSAVRSGYAAVVVTGLAYSGVAIWHFIEHANGADPELAHVLLAVAQVAMIVAAIAVTLATRTAGKLRPGSP